MRGGECKFAHLRSAGTSIPQLAGTDAEDGVLVTARGLQPAPQSQASAEDDDGDDDTARDACDDKDGVGDCEEAAADDGADSDGAPAEYVGVRVVVFGSGGVLRGLPGQCGDRVGGEGGEYGQGGPERGPDEPACRGDRCPTSVRLLPLLEGGASSNLGLLGPVELGGELENLIRVSDALEAAAGPSGAAGGVRDLAAGRLEVLEPLDVLAVGELCFDAGPKRAGTELKACSDVLLVGRMDFGDDGHGGVPPSVGGQAAASAARKCTVLWAAWSRSIRLRGVS
ncbi:hypothetical protein GCM10020254_87650 [Streptomyces goshikiensis]